MAKSKKQTEIPGTEKKRVDEIEDAAEALRDASDALKKATKKRDEAKDRLREAMQKHKVKTYPLEEFDPPLEAVIEVVHEEAKLRKMKPTKDEGLP